jgi:hypothetical protein
MKIKLRNPFEDEGFRKEPPSSSYFKWSSDAPPYVIVGGGNPVRDESHAEYHALWKELHAKENPTAEWFANWMSRIPKDCGCGESLVSLLKRLPPRFDDWFNYSVYLHNAINQKLNKVQYGPLDARVLVRGENDLDKMVQLIQPKILRQVIVPSKDRAVLVLACDDKTREEFRHTRPRMEAYARKHNLDFVVIGQITQQTHKCGNKYAYSEIAHLWEQTLWLDTDVVVDPSAPNIFDSVPPGSWGMVDDLAVMENTDWFNSEFKMCQGYWGVEQSNLPSAWNSGVVVAPRNAADCYYPPPMRVPNVWCAEQHWHTQALLMHQASVITLPEIWNNGFPWKEWHNNIPKSYFNHVNGCKPQSLRVKILKHLANGKKDLSSDILNEFSVAWRPGWLDSEVNLKGV